MYSGCDINSPRKPGPGGRGGEESKDLSSPLHLCCHWGLQSVVQTLLEHGANVNAWVNTIWCIYFQYYIQLYNQKQKNCFNINYKSIKTIIDLVCKINICCQN